MRRNTVKNPCYTHVILAHWCGASLSIERSTFRRPSASHPRHTGPPTPNPSANPFFPSHLSSRPATPTPSRTLNRPEVPSRRLPSPPRPRTSSTLEQFTANYGHSEPPPRCASTPSLPPSLPLATPLYSSLRASLLSPEPHVISSSQHHSASSSAHACPCSRPVLKLARMSA